MVNVGPYSGYKGFYNCQQLRLGILYFSINEYMFLGVGYHFLPILSWDQTVTEDTGTFSPLPQSNLIFPSPKLKYYHLLIGQWNGYKSNTAEHFKKDFKMSEYHASKQDFGL